MAYHIYTTRGIVLARRHAGESSMRILLLSEQHGLLYAKAVSSRKSSAKLTSATTPFAYGEYSLVRGKGEWRLVNVRDIANMYLDPLMSEPAKESLSKNAYLIRSLVHGEGDGVLYHIMMKAYRAYCTPCHHKGVELSTHLSLLNALGYAREGELPIATTEEEYRHVASMTLPYIELINKGLRASQLGYTSSNEVKMLY